MEQELKKLDHRPKLLLHVCCAPCSSAVIERMVNYCDICVLFYNPNMDSEMEFIRRAEELNRLVSESGWSVDVAVLEYDHSEFLEIANGLEDAPEGGARCMKCYRQRLEETAKYAAENGFEYFTTTLSISPYKNAEALNLIGKSLEEKYNVKYLYSDFKKKNGFKRSTELSDEYGLYRQDYCGCEFSKEEREAELKKQCSVCEE
ncbi:epoxyqueuosine reductase QueH [Peptoniphilus asaccharolyticus]|nr:epoxyqueuosine reductase QueH [Peptoniphilus asaccharolyticus]MBL7574755.1 epoxyqueuosine reductase QueH [Peptoniphilus asaccharolyticus]